MWGGIRGLAAQEPPTIPPQITVLTTEQLKRMLDTREVLVLVDTRDAQEYRAGHIPHAMHLPTITPLTSPDVFSQDRSLPLVFYGNGLPKCLQSLRMAQRALAWGYTNISLYATGLPAWEKLGYPMERD